jgi:hypothetical protein
MSRLRSLFHPASLLSVVALTLGLGSTAFAAGMITGADIKDGTVSTADIHDGTLKTRDLAGSTVSQLRGATGPAGPAGPAGPSGVSGWEIVTTQQTVAANTPTDLHKDCPTGKKALSLDGYWESAPDAVQVLLASDGSGGYAISPGVNVTLGDTLHLQLVCATVG